MLAVGLGYYKLYESQISGDVPVRTLGPKCGWIGRSHIEWRGERVPARTLGPEGGWIVRSYIGWREERSILY